MRPTSFLLLVPLLGACPPARPRPPRPRVTPLEELGRRLDFPPTPETGEALRQIQARGRQGSGPARWLAVSYLVDLFDLARLSGDAMARRLLWRSLGLGTPVGRGQQATRRVLNGLATRLAAVARPGGPRRAPALLRLIRSDLAWLARPARFPKRLALLKAERRGPAAGAALLRLYAICAQAFRAAVQARPENRSRVLNHCLYPLYDLDPAPHLRRIDPPPHPPWAVYRAGLAALGREIDRLGERAAVLADHLARRDNAFFQENRHRLPLLLGPHLDHLPLLQRGRRAAGHSALLVIRDRLVTPARVVTKPGRRDYAVALSEAFFAGDKQPHLTVFATAGIKLSRFRILLEKAADAGFFTVGFGGRRPVATVGYWTLDGAGPAVERREIPVSLAPISVAARYLKIPEATLGWSRHCARHGLTVHLAATQVTGAGPDGALPPVAATGEGPAEALLQVLERLHEAFPTACAVSLSADRALGYGRFLAALAAVRGSVKPGVRAFRYLGVRLDPPKRPAGGGTFAARVRIRLAARASIHRWPRAVRTERDSLLGAVRACYLESLDRTPSRWANLEVRSLADRAVVSQQRGTSPEELSLNHCVARAAHAWRQRHRVDRDLTFQLRLRP